MAVKDLNEARAQQKKSARKNKPVFSIVLAAFTAFWIGVGFLCYVVPNYIAAAQHKTETEEIRSSITALSEESAEISKDLKNKDELYEKIAREEYGYCKPGEKVYYNSSFGE